MTEPADIEGRLARVEQRVEEAAADAAAARHLASASDRDLADLGVKVDAHRRAINALGLQTASRFDTLEGRFDTLEGRFDTLERRFDVLERRVDEGFAAAAQEFEQIDRNFVAVGARFDLVAAGQQRIVELLDTIIARDTD